MPWPTGLDLVATHDILLEGVHFLPACPAFDVGWKLVAVNLSDLAAMGARPVAVLMGAAFGAARGAGWGGDFLRGMAAALGRFGGTLIGGDTVRAPAGTALSLTALGSVPPGAALSRGGARAGDDIWVSGTIGDAGPGLLLARGESPAPGSADAFLLRRYRRPMARVALGVGLRGIATAAMDISDGLLLDASRMAEASGVSARMALGALPISEAAAEWLEAGRVTRLFLATSGDDYELLFTAPYPARDAVVTAAAAAGVSVSRIGCMTEDETPLQLMDAELPAELGYRHA